MINYDVFHFMSSPCCIYPQPHPREAWSLDKAGLGSGQPAIPGAVGAVLLEPKSPASDLLISAKDSPLVNTPNSIK